MISEESLPPTTPEPERSPLLIDSPERRCVVCGRQRGPRKRETCSDACRTALNRQRKADAERKRKAETRALLEAALENLREDP